MKHKTTSQKLYRVEFHTSMGTEHGYAIDVYADSPASAKRIAASRWKETHLEAMYGTKATLNATGRAAYKNFKKIY